MKILGIETSCDETGAAVVEDGHTLLSNVVLSSMDLHKAYGGVVPEIAARSHIEAILPVINEALISACERTDLSQNTKITSVKNYTDTPVKGRTFHTTPCEECWGAIDGVAVTYGAGLGGSLLIGVMTARTIALIRNKPLYAINHVEAHAYANFLTQVGSKKQKAKSKTGSDKTQIAGYSLPAAPPRFPMLGLIVSGGHSQLVLWRDHFDYTLLGQTSDDAIGEAFDKVAKVLGLPYPGGPSVSKKAEEGDPHKHNLPKAKFDTPRSQFSDEAQGGSKDSKGAVHKSTVSADRSDNAVIRAAIESRKYDFSFSGLKTAVLRLAQAQVGEDYSFPSFKLAERLSEAQKADIAASFQHVAIETIVDKTVQAYEEFKPQSVVIGGGVAASPELRRQLDERLPIKVQYPDMKLCTDNGAMVAALGCFKALLNQDASDPYSLAIQPNLSM